ncbi:MAG: DMT family transporter [Caldilineaceae bacterium]|nr:DMT family transporter [Caldilineaceae bacterium]MBP8107047.1 DMT family transporter [Caldilineaceae bacterium]MBP8121085.1 DMT family transporter [Caldilineaceae bacterium]MBP9070798.1 DMT family transporter [Caldilineaceae bacterium]
MPRPRLLFNLAALPTWMLALVPALLWGSSFVVTKAIYADWPPITVAAGRWLIATLFFAGWVGVRGQLGTVTQAVRAHPGTIFAFGLVGVGALYVTQNLALNYTTVTNVSVLGNLFPVFVLLLSILVLGERVSRTLAVAVLGATVGAGLVSVAGGAVTVAPEHLVGDGLAILAAIAGAVYIVLGKRIVDGFSPAVVTLLAAGTGSLFLVPLALIIDGIPPMPSLGAVGGLLILGLGSSAVANLVWWMVAERMEASRAALFILLVPLIGALSGVLFLGEPVTWQMLLGGSMILAALYLAQMIQAEQK